MKNLVFIDFKLNDPIRVNKHKLLVIETKLPSLLNLIREQHEKWSIKWYNSGYFASKFRKDNEELINEITDLNNNYYCGINCIKVLKHHLSNFNSQTNDKENECIKLIDDFFIEQNKKLIQNKNIIAESVNQIIGNLGENDVFLLENYFGNQNDLTLFNELNDELMFGKMFLQNSEVPRGIVIQSQHNSNTFPIYRHPCDKQPQNTPFSPIVSKLIEKINSDLKININHALIQKYNDGKSNISEHSDKTLDMDPNTPIINASFGTTRTLVLTNKLTREKQKIKLYNNSLFIMGLKTNMKWTHEIIKSDDNLPRISLTLRKINTFLVNLNGNNYIYGQGAIYKTFEELEKNLENYEETLYSDLIDAFSKENKSDSFSWEEIYSKGFNYYN